MKDDKSTTLLEIKRMVREAYKELDGKPRYSLQDFSMDLAICASKVMQVTKEFPELVEDREFRNNEWHNRKEISNALLDVFMSAINLANHLDLDIATGIQEVMDHWQSRWLENVNRSKRLL